MTNNQPITVEELLESLSEYDKDNPVQCLTPAGDAFKITELTRCKITGNIIVNIESVTGYFLN